LRQVALRGSIAGAAREVGLSASAVSQQIAILEREAGISLIERSPRGVNLTGAGRALADRARLIEDLLEQARADLDREALDASGVIRIGAVASAAATILSSAATKLSPRIELRVQVAEPSVSIAALLADDLDLAVVDVYDGVPLALPDYLVATELLVEPLMVVAASGHSFGPATKLAQLAQQHWVMPPESAACGRAVRFACRAAGFEPDVRWETDDMLLLAMTIAAGHGIAILPKLVLAQPAGLDLIPLRKPALSRRITALTRSSSTGRAVVTETLTALAKAAQRRRA
jgi:DNA-binding transcriptional LysR family regulator